MLVGPCKHVHAVTHRGICQSRDLYKCLGLRGKGLSSSTPEEMHFTGLRFKTFDVFVVVVVDGGGLFI